MFARITQPGLISIFDADYANPLKIWEKRVREGQIKRVLADDVKGLILSMSSGMPGKHYIQCPQIAKQALGIHYPFFHMLVKPTPNYVFSFDVQVLDDKDVKRRFRMSTNYNTTEIHPFVCKLPLSVESGWNNITIPLHEYVKNIYGTNYVLTNRVAVYPNCALKKVYFSDRNYADEDLPNEFHIEDVEHPAKKNSSVSSTDSQKNKSLNSDNSIQNRKST